MTKYILQSGSPSNKGIVRGFHMGQSEKQKEHHPYEIVPTGVHQETRNGERDKHCEISKPALPPLPQESGP
jgi:hypothetical protein